MILVLKPLFSLLSVGTFVAASVPHNKQVDHNAPSSGALPKVKYSNVPQLPLDFVNDITKGMSNLVIQDPDTFEPFDEYVYSEGRERGQILRQALEGTKMEELTHAVDTEIGMIAESMSERGNALAVVLLDCFEDIQEKMIDIALKSNMSHLLRIFVNFNYLESKDHLLLLKLASFGKSWFNRKVFDKLRVDWSTKLDLIFKADNPKFFHALQDGRIVASSPINFKATQQSLFEHICINDSIEIYKSLSASAQEEFAQDIKTPFEHGAIEILKFLAEKIPLELERYPTIPLKLPKNEKDLMFLIGQGFNLTFQEDWLTIACGSGLVAYLRYSHNNDNMAEPDDEDFELAARSGQLEVLKFARESSLAITFNARAMKLVISNGHLEVLKFLVDEYGMKISQETLDFACSEGQLGTFKWIYNRLEQPRVPDLITLSKTSVGIIKFLQKMCPSIVSTKLAEIADMPILKYLWDEEEKKKAMGMKFQTLFTEKVKRAQMKSIDSDEKMWCIYDIWNELPTSVNWDISICVLKYFEKEFGKEHLPPEMSKSIVNSFVIAENYENLLWFHKHFPHSVDVGETLLYLVKNQRLDIADHFKGSLGIEQEMVKVREAFFSFLSGTNVPIRLNTMKWAYENYKIVLSADCWPSFVYDGRLEIVKWMLTTAGYVDSHGIDNLLYLAIEHQQEDICDFLKAQQRS